MATFTSIYSTTLTSAATLSITSIPSSYRQLYLEINTNVLNVMLRFNGSSSSYQSKTIGKSGSSSYDMREINASSLWVPYGVSGGGSDISRFQIWLHNYKDTQGWKTGVWQHSGYLTSIVGAGAWSNISAITSITSTNTLPIGTTIKLYGIG